MKTTKMRKRMLVSSLAMLLVAMVALGSATYAWFTSNTTATAKGINVKTIQASELVISDYTKTWDTTVNYGVANKVLIPASSANGTTWFTANAESKGSFAKKDTDDFEPAQAPIMGDETSSSYVYFDQLNVMNKGAADVEDVTISFTFPSNNYLRVALVPAESNGTIDGTFTSCVYDNAGLAYDAVATATTTTKITPKTTYEVSVGDLKGTASLGEGATTGEAAYYNLYVWFEGQDEECVDANAGQIISDIEFTVSGNTADQLATTTAQG